MCKRIAGPEKMEIVSKQAKDQYEAEALIKNTSAEISGQRPIEEILKNNEARYQSLFNRSKNAIAVYEAVAGGENFIFTDFNGTGERVEGINKGDLIGRRVTEVFPGVKDMGLFEVLGRVWRTGEPEELPASFYKDDRISGWKENYVYKLPSGEVVAIYDDVTERKRAEEVHRESEEQANQLARENAIIAEIGRIIGSTLDIGEVYDRFAQEVQKVIPFDRLNINLVDSKARTVTSAYSAGKALKGRRIGDVFPLEGSVTEEIMKTRSGLVFHPKDEAELESRFPILLPSFKVGYRSMMTVPLISKDKVIGNLYFGSKQPGDFTDRDLRLAENIGTQIAGAIANAQLFMERKQMEELLRRNEEQFRELYDQAPVGYHEYDAEGRMTNVNRTDLEMLGYTAEEMIGQYVWTFNVEAELARQQILAKLSGAMPPARNLERTYRRKDGTTFPVLCQDRLVLDKTGKITGMRCTIQDITERKRAEEKMSVLHRFQNEMLDTDAIWIDTLDPQGNITFWNRAAEYISGYSRQEVLGNKKIWGWLYPDPNCSAQVSQRAMEVIQQGKRSQNYETVIRRKDGEHRVISWCSSSLKDQEGKAIGSIVLGADVTERKQAEEKMALLQDQLRQSQKMEAIGCLAGGIAHDFNNLLTVIKGYSQISLDELKDGDPLIENLKEIRAAGNRASDLTRQLLAFSRRQVLEFKVIDLNKLIGGMEQMLCRILGEDIELLIHASEDLGRIKTDPGQMEQVIMNLAVNSREAMPSGGKLILETDNVYLDDEYARNHISVKPGRYVRFSVSDTGRGMTPEVKDRIFEPFFTTKGKEKGTGLGLSTVYGIVKQSEGNIWVYSEPGKGTTFKIYLPRVDEPVPIEKSEKKREGVIPCGSETVLVVEDEEVVRRLAVRILKKQGYKVLEAPNSGEAFLVCENHKEPIDLILTDVVMPRMGGPEFIGRLRQIRQDFKVVYMSGYTDEAVVFHGVREGEMAFIQKPFTFEDLSTKVREVLDR
jgi:two-component system cell cycle sensor histidine kinase/response regulator CckA